MNDESTTGINTRWKNSTFYWKGGFERTLQHPISQLPEMALVSPKTTPFANYTHRCNSLVDDTVLFHHSSCYSCNDDVTSPPPAIITQEEIDIESPFDIGERLFYTNEGHTSMVIVKDIIRSHDSATKFIVEFPNHRSIRTTADCLRKPNQPDIAEIPVTPEDFLDESTKLSLEDCKSIANPAIVSPEQQELMSYHERLYHVPFSVLI